MSVGSDAGAGYAGAVSAVRAAAPEQRRGVLADYVVEYGAPFVSSLASTAPELTGEANEVLASWLSGERVTRRADEGERRILELRRQAADTDDTLLARLAADAILRLPAGHELRDEAFATDVLLTQARRGAEPDGDVNDLLVAVFYLLHHDLVAPGDFAGLIDEAIAAVNSRHPHPSAVRDLVFAAHSYCVSRAAEGLGTRGETYDLWLARAQRLLDIAADASFGLEFGPRLAGMRARQFDVADDARRAADAYAEFLAAAGAGGTPDSGTTVWAALSEATLRLEIGEHQRVLEQLGPLTDELLDRYLTAVTDADVARTGFAHGQAVSLLTSALVHLDDAEAAFRVIDTGKSARLRYRAALRQHPDRERILALERAILAASRGGAGGADGTGGDGAAAGLPLRTQLFEQYRRLRPSLGAPVSRARTATEVAAALGENEAAVVLAALQDMTVLWLVRADGATRCTALLAYGWGFWDTLLDGRADGWRRLLTAQGAPGGSAAGLRNARLFHFSGHAYSDHGNPDRSALLVAPAGSFTADPFP